MEALTFMKFWLTNPTGKTRREVKISESTVGSSTLPEIDICEGDDSFFELEISLTNFSIPEEKESKQQTFSVSKSKVLPFVELSSKPQSPITLLKSGAFSFKKSKPVDSEKSNNRSLNVSFKIDDDNASTTTSFRKTASFAKSQYKDDSIFEDSASSSPVSTLSSSSKRFFSLIKPLYTKTSKKQNSSGSSTPSTSSPAREKQRSGIRSVRRQLGKSRSASAVVGVMSPANRVDESLQVQQDGIQSAILHCKKSFHGSKESYNLSRSISDSSSQEKLSTSSSEDSYLFSRIGSDSMSETSIDSLTSIKEQN